MILLTLDPFELSSFHNRFAFLCSGLYFYTSVGEGAYQTRDFLGEWMRTLSLVLVGFGLVAGGCGGVANKYRDQELTTAGGT